MALDHLLALNCQPEDIPILRFYGWSPYCVSIGYHQKKDLINFVKLKQDGCDFVQRPTGGRAIFHAEELTYSVISPRNYIHHKKIYHFFHHLFAEALNAIGYPVELKTDNEKLGALTHRADDFPCFTKSAQTEVQFENKKLIGSAQKFYEGAILQHGSLLIGKKHQSLPEYLKVNSQTKENIEMEIKEKTICLVEIKKEPISQEKIIQSIINQLELVRGISVNSRKLNKLELESAKGLKMSFPRKRESK
jgi:lipoate-protein ligase A